MDEVEPLPTPCGGPRVAELRRLDTGEIVGPARERMLAHVDSCRHCQQVLREFQADRRAAQTTIPFAAIERGLTFAGRIGRQRRDFSRWLANTGLAPWAMAVAGIGVALLIVNPPPDWLATYSAQSPESEHPGIRSKGGDAPAKAEEDVQLDFLVLPIGRGSSWETAASPDDTVEVRKGHDGDRLREGDRIRFRYDSHGFPYVLIVGVDADGKVFPYVADGDRSRKASLGREYAANSIELDADVRPERVFALYSREPIGVDEVSPAARDGLAQAGGIETLTKLPGFATAAVRQATILINKAADANTKGGQ